MNKYNKKLKTSKTKKHNRKQNYKKTMTYQTPRRSYRVTLYTRNKKHQQPSEDAQTSEDGHLTSEDEMQTTQTSETYEKQQKIQIQIPQPKNMPLSAKKVFDWWTSPVNNNITHPKYEMNPNRLKECMEHHCSKSVKEECERSCGSRRPKFDFH